MGADEAEISEYPCAVCMGFCIEDSNSILCDHCMNWFHRECVNLSKTKFALLSNDKSSKFTCTICIHKRKCETCCRSPRMNEKFIYCVTCLKHYCRECTSFLSDQFDTYLTTDIPYYCLSCATTYLCKFCEKQCYQDSVHQPCITCASCDSKVHFQCTKLTKRQFSRFKNTIDPYFCMACIAENIPMSTVSNNKLASTFVSNSPSPIINDQPMNTLCTLCIECNNECEECITCSNPYRLCSSCTSPCLSLNVTELDTLFSTKESSDLSLLHINIRSLSKNILALETFPVPKTVKNMKK